MTNYKFDGRILRSRSGAKVAEFDGRHIKDAHGQRIGEIEGKNIKDSHGHRLAEFDGKVIRQSGSKIGTIDDVTDDIDGAGGISLVALWLLAVR